MNFKTILMIGIVVAGLGVAIGAFGAHGLKGILAKTGRTETFELAVRYQFYHAFAIIIAGILARVFAPVGFQWATICFLGGIIFFSGSLYILSLTGKTWLGAITPIGGVLFIVGWILLLVQVSKTTS